MTTMPTTLTVVARMRAVPHRLEDLRAALAVMIDATRQEDGCRDYDLHVHADDPHVFVFHENWASREAWEAHNASEHVAAFRAQAGALLDGPARVDPLYKLD